MHVQPAHRHIAGAAAPFLHCQTQGVRAPVRSARLAAPKAAAAEVATTVSQEVVDKCVNAIRFLAIDAVNKAKSGHPGLPMGAAPMSYVLFNETMKFNPKNPAWFNRDRFVLSAGHGSMLQYALMHLVGYDSVTVSVIVCAFLGGNMCWGEALMPGDTAAAAAATEELLCPAPAAHRMKPHALMLCAPCAATTVLLQLDDIKQFRQWDSKTPGHPENFLTPGVEVTTGEGQSGS